ncbi:hypothetical protein [Devosia salina]|uniref:Uncharacterized protein n=1 Tax=Devosia salina TaxID=2860336 RepID=A0ABX8WLK4_9HYPH|nr:hypothetical protein [Devosia salina]QYO78901.1 hypothetical protein K1X15_10345 [Devosia salina]
MTEEMEEQGGTSGTQILVQPRIGSSLRRPISATETRVVAEDEDSEN